MRKVKLISDYTPINNPNYLDIIEDNQGDYHIRFVKLNDKKDNIRIAAEGTKYSYKVRLALSNLMNVIKEEKY